MNEQLTLSKLLEEEPYNSKTGSAINFQTDKFEIKLDLGLPRSSRIRGQIGVNGSGNTGIIPYDSWEVKPVIGYIAGRVGHNSSGEPNLPKLRVSITPKVLKARGSDDYNEMLELLERIRNIIVSVQLRKL